MTEGRHINAGFRNPVVKREEVSQSAGEPVSGQAKLPSLAVMVGNVIGAVGRVVKGKAAGRAVLVSAAESARRVGICEANTCGFYRVTDRRCAKCGCPVKGQLAVKTKLATEKCPVGLW